MWSIPQLKDVRNYDEFIVSFLSVHRSTMKVNQIQLRTYDRGVVASFQLRP